MLFVLLQLSVWIPSRTRLASHRRKKCDAEFVKILMYIHPKCEGIAIIVHVFGVEVTEFRKNKVNSCEDFGSFGNLWKV